MKLKALFFTLLFFTTSSIIAKENNLPIPVTVNESITVTLFFPSEIKKVIEPAVNYKFEYEQNGTMGTLMARKGVASNLTVITKDGSIFSFLLKYDQEVDNFTYVLSSDQAIGVMEPRGITTGISAARETERNPSFENQTAEKPQKKVALEKVKDEKPMVRAIQSDTEGQERADFTKTVASQSFANEIGEGSLYDTDKESYYEIFCENNYNRKFEFDTSKSVKAGAGIELKLNALTADKKEFYFILQVTNRLTSSFTAEKLQFFVRTSLEDKPVQMTPLHIYNHQEDIEAGRTKKMVYVFQEFRLSEDQKVYVTLDELNGIRSTVLNIDGQMINAIGEELVSTEQ